MPDRPRGERSRTAAPGGRGRTAKPAPLRSDGTPRRPAYREAHRDHNGAAPQPGGAHGRSATGSPSRAAPAARADREGLPPAAGEPERLQKVLAAAGVGPRRVCENLIAAGRVRVDGLTAQVGMKVDPVNAEIYVDGDRVITDSRRVYLALNKPAGVVSTMSDEWGRAALADYLGSVRQRVYHVGRLDADSEGLLLLTNDGNLAHRLTHPSYGVPKTYLVEMRGPLGSGVRRQLLSGVDLEDGSARLDSFRVVETSGRRLLAEVVIHEGRKHIVRRLLAEVGHPVNRLVRTAIGPVRLGDLRSGRTRRLSPAEIAALFHAAEPDSPAELP